MFAFIPVVPVPPPSARAEELGQRLAETIERFRQQYPDLERADVIQAFRIAATRAGGQSAAARSAMIAAAVGALLVGVLAALAASGGWSLSSAMAVPIVLATLVCVLLVVVVLKRR